MIYLQRIGLAIILLTTVRCGADRTPQNGTCPAPKFNTTELANIRSGAFASGPTATLVKPNPIEATGNINATMTSADTLAKIKSYRLPDLLSPQRLESDLLKIRINGPSDSLSILASPQSNGSYNYSLSDVHYSEAQVYHSLSVSKHYLEALGFSMKGSRPIMVSVRATYLGNTDEANAFYINNLDSSQPHEMVFIGGGNYPTAVDADPPGHEFGHYALETLTRDRGIDLAGEAGATFTEGRAIHECTGDYLLYASTNKTSIGTWVARNFSSIPIGNPLRSGVDAAGTTLKFDSVISADGTGDKPFYYDVGEWCSRALVDFRSNLGKTSGADGLATADAVIFSALSTLPQDASMSDYLKALIATDQKLYCGTHVSAIRDAFSKRGFAETPSRLAQPLRLTASLVTFNVNSQGDVSYVSPRAGAMFAFEFSVTNPNGIPARNVRLVLESVDDTFIPLTYLQGLGDLPASRAVQGTKSNSLIFVLSPIGQIDSAAKSGTKVRGKIKVITENGDSTSLNVEIPI